MSALTKQIAILGSTGSIGVNTLKVIRTLPAEAYRATALTTHSRVADLIQQAIEHRPAVVGITGPELSAADRKQFDALNIEVIHSPSACEQIVSRSDNNTVVSAVVGAAGLPASVRAVQLRKPLALANKESLVVAGSVLMPLARESGTPIFPIDSEHSAILQCLLSGKASEVSRLILTASGGPFRTVEKSAMYAATAEQALNHPTWKMGRKITIDSATMFNKALELIEAAWLFDVGTDKLDVVVHPQSIIHSMVEFVDGSTLAQLSPPDMRTPIQYALTYPDRLPSTWPRLNTQQATTLELLPVDREKFPSLDLGMRAIRQGGTTGCALNAANEVAVEAFLSGKIPLGMIFDVVDRIVEGHDFRASPTLEQLLELDAKARESAKRLIQTRV
jgi:1-deoxy-D-xylulose-5-phosphate reductoisomerase